MNGRGLSQVEAWRLNGAMKAWERALRSSPGTPTSDLLDAISTDIQGEAYAMGGHLPPGWTWVDQEPVPPEPGHLPEGWTLGADGKPVCPLEWRPGS
jgi:hypothetical protein